MSVLLILQQRGHLDLLGLVHLQTDMGNCCNTNLSKCQVYPFPMQVCTHPRRGEMLVCPVIVTRDLDHYFAIHSVVDPPRSLVEQSVESVCIGYVNINKTFYKPSSAFALFFYLFFNLVLINKRKNEEFLTVLKTPCRIKSIKSELEMTQTVNYDIKFAFTIDIFHIWYGLNVYLYCNKT